PPQLKEPPELAPGPALRKPAAGATLDNGSPVGSKTVVWAFEWSDVPGATQYHLCLIGPTSTVPNFNRSTYTSSSCRLETRLHVPDQFRLGWRWKVRALVKGVWTDWSERTFDVAPPDDSKPASPRK